MEEWNQQVGLDDPHDLHGHLDKGELQMNCNQKMQRKSIEKLGNNSYTFEKYNLEKLWFLFDKCTI